jgi:25S rRNA (adenine2142-N1)-methyltransferase
MLEIGAVSPSNYANCSTWIENHPIDVHSQHPHIFEQDFFERPIPTLEAEQFDVISCSLVLNFVDDPQERGV